MSYKKNKRGLVAVVENLNWWQIGLVSLTASVLGRLAGGFSKKDTQLYTKELNEAPWAPPKWLFGPAWTVNNFFTLLALQRVIKNSNLPEKHKLLLLQAGIWTIFFSFNYVYFRKKSTVLAAVWSVADMVLANTSLYLTRKDTKTALSYAPLAGWTIYASSLAIYQALTNKDKALNIEAPVEIG
jgi:tryptophan-rich sensory protein